MTNTEHLQRIRARCVELLAIAEKRKEGKWIARDDDVINKKGDYIAACFSNYDGRNSAFIAYCAGSAEAGWRATIAAIDGLLATDGANYKCVDAIIAAWPEDLL